MREKIYEGKSKIILTGEDDKSVVIRYKDTATAFNGEKKAELEGKGLLNAEISEIIFDRLEKAGIKTHRIRRISDTDFLVKKVEVVMVEVIIRNVAAGSFSRRFGTPEGTELKNIIVEFSFKSDEYGDPMINNSQITAIGLATEKELEQMASDALKVNEIMGEMFAKVGIRLVDFKLEFGRFDGEILLCDEISPDSCRFWDIKTGEKLDKDRFRRDLGDVLEGYRDVLNRLG